MYIFAELQKSLSSTIDLELIFRNIFENQINQMYIVKLIRERIRNTGRDSKNVKLRTDTAKATGRPYYAVSTEKRKKGVNHVNLTDSGATLDNLQVSVENNIAYISVNQRNVPYYVYISLNFRTHTAGQPFDDVVFTFSDSEMETFVKQIYLPQFKKLLNTQINKVLTTI